MTERPDINRYKRYIRRPVTTNPRPITRPAPILAPKSALAPKTPEIKKSAPEPMSEPKNVPKLQKKPKKKLWLALVTLVLVAAVAAAGYFFVYKSSSPVPKNITKAVKFTVYYPDAKKLPKGYALDLSSFNSPVKEGVTYTVNYDDTRKIVFSLQAKPTDAEIQTFNGNYLPLHTSYQTPVGEAEIGAYNSKSFVSLPTTGGTWIVMIAPGDINQDQFKQVISSIKK